MRYNLILSIMLLAVSARWMTAEEKSPAPIMDESGAYVINYKLLTQTNLPQGKPAVFPPDLKKLKGKKVTLSGFVQPFEDAQDMWSFMLIQYPVGCWYCEAPGPTTIVLVELPENKELDNKLTTNAVKITGTLELNEEDPEDFLYIITEASAARSDYKAPPPSSRPPPKPRPHPQ